MTEVKQIKKVLHINTVITHCEELIAHGVKFLLILDIDDTILSTRPNQCLVEPHIRRLIELAHTNPCLCSYIFCTARHSSHRKRTLDQLNRAKLIDVGEYVNYKVLHSPHVTFTDAAEPQPTKGNAILTFLRGADIDPDNTHIIVVDDDIDQIEHIHYFLNQSEYAKKYTLWHYIASWAQSHQCWISPILPSTTEAPA